MKYKIATIILSWLIIAISFILGNIFPYKIDNTVDLSKFKASLFRIKVCNNTGYDFKNSKINNVYLGEVKVGECSLYKNIGDLKRIISSEIITKENGVLHKYKITPIDLVGEKPLSFGEHTININQLTKTDFKLIQYSRSIKYDIK